MDLESLAIRISLSAENISAEIDALKGSLSELESAHARGGAAAQQAGKQTTQSFQEQGAAASNMSGATTAAYAAMAAAAAKALSTVVGWINDGIEAYNRYVAALQGVESVAQGMGVSQGALSGAMAELEDQFFDTAAAATSLKNLLSRGYTLDQAVATINRLKDAAAFGRQATMGLADAVVSATSGIKQENSILVDNAGVTKNVSRMWADYAKSVGISVESMTQQQKVLAEVSGIATETQHQVGDLAKMSETLAGTQASAAMSGELLARSFGEAMAPAAEVVYTVLTGLLDIVRGVTEASPPLTAGLTTAGVAIAGLVGAQKAIAALDMLKASFVKTGAAATGMGAAMGAAMPWLLVISAVVGVGTAIWTGYKKAQEDAAEAAEKAAQKQREDAAAQKEKVSTLRDLQSAYTRLTSKQKLTYKETQELGAVTKQLADEYGVIVDNAPDVVQSLEDITASMAEQTAEAVRQYEALKLPELNKNRENARFQSLEGKPLVGQDAQMKLYDAQAIRDAAKAVDEAGEEYADAWERLSIIRIYAEDAIEHQFDNFNIFEELGQLLKDSGGDLEAALAEYTKGLSEVVPTGLNDAGFAAYTEVLEGELRHTIEVLKIMAPEIGNAMESVVDSISFEDVLKGFLDLNPEPTTDDIEAFIDGVVAFVRGIDLQGELSGAFDMMETLGEMLMKGENPSESLKKEMESAFNDLWDSGLLQDLRSMFGDAGVAVFDALTHGMRQAAGDGDFSEFWGDVKENFNTTIADMSDAEKGVTFDNLKSQAGDMIAKYEGIEEAIEKSRQKMLLLAEAQRLMNPNGEFKDGSGDAQLQEIQERLKTEFNTNVKSYDDAVQMFKDAVAAVNAAQSELSAEGTVQAFGDIRGQITDTIAALLEEQSTLEENSEALRANKAAVAELKDIRDGLDFAKSDAYAAQNQSDYIDFDAATASTAAYKQALQGITTQAVALTTQQQKLSTVMNNVKEWNKPIKDLKANTEEWTKAQKALGLTAESTQEDFDAAFKGYSESAGRSLSDIKGSAEDLKADLYDLITAANARGTVDIDTSTAQAMVEALLADLMSMEEFMEALGMTTGGGGGGGGGGSQYQKDIAYMEHRKKLNQMTFEEELDYLSQLERQYTNAKGKSKLTLEEQRDLAERLYQIQEDIRRKNLENDYADLAHEKAMGRTTLENEIAVLEQIRRNHQLNAEELREIEERLYEAYEALRQNNLQSDYDLLNHRKNMGELSVEQEIAMLEQIKQAHELTNAELWSLEEQLYSAYEALRQERFQADMDYYNHQKNMGELTIEDEIHALETMLQAHILTQAERWSLEEQLYALRKQLQDNLEREAEAARNAEIKGLDTLAKGVIKALKERYKAALDEEKALLAKSKDTWKEWSDENVAAIQAQIDALDKLLKSEDREAQDAAELKKIASLQESIMFEQDEYSRRQLQAQLEAAIQERETRLRKQSIEDQKDALKEEMELIKEKAKAETEAIDEQQKALEAQYAERTKDAAIQAEAERLLMEGNQQAMLDLMGEFAPDYEMSGKSLGERWLDGFFGAVGNVGGFLDDISAQFAEIQAQVAQMALDSADSFYATQRQASQATADKAAQQVTLYNENNFNVPVESPYDTQRRIEKANQDLARLL